MSRIEKIHQENWSRLPAYQRVIFVMLLLASCFLLASCYGPRKAERQLLRVHATYPAITTKAFKLWFPPITFDSNRVEYIPGAVQWRYDTVIVDCDSVLRNWPPAGGADGADAPLPRVVRMPCPPCPIRVDTLRYFERQIQQSQVALEDMRHDYEKLSADKQKRIDEADKTILSQAKKISRQGGFITVLLIAVSVLGIYTIGRWVLRYLSKGTIKLP